MTQLSLFDVPAPARPAESPPHNGTPTSKAAAESVREHVGRLRGVVLEAIREAGGTGMTTDEVEVATGLIHQCASPRVKENAEAGSICELRDTAGETVKRPTRSGRKAVVWIAREFAKKG